MQEHYPSLSAHNNPDADHANEDRSENGLKPSSKQNEWATALIGWVLQGGVLLSAVVILLGVCLLPTRPGGLSPQRLLVFPFTWSQLATDLVQFRPQGVITVGLLLLIATPVLRVAVSIVTFIVEQ